MQIKQIGKLIFRADVWLYIAFIGCVLVGLYVTEYNQLDGDDTDLGRAKMDVMSMEQAVNIYRNMHGKYPETLEELAHRGTDDSPAILKDKSVLIDPWRQPYKYDPHQLNPKTGNPLIWSDGPPGGNSPIKNWR